MYFSYVRPIVEYADVVWDNCPNYIKEKLEHINYEAARIITGATKLTSIRILLQECGWETLEQRRNKHNILLFHKMVNKTFPEYLSNLVPSSFGQTHQYSTRNHSNLVHVHSRTAYYNNSFLPSTVRLWNELPANIKSNVSVNSMKIFLNNTINPVPSYFYAGSRIGQILHTRIRTESSALKDHLYKKNIEANPYCSCKLVETSEHFLFKCSLYERLRNDLFVNLSSHLNINNLLFGDSNLPDCENESNFLVIQDFIIKSKRFTSRI